MERGGFVSVEGADGSGKGTLIKLIQDALADETASGRVLFIREPGGTELGEQIREVLQHFSGNMADSAELQLFLAARAQILEEVVEPALRSGKLVIADRFHDSTIAYQGGGRGLQVEWPNWVPRPDLTILLDIDAETAQSRSTKRGEKPTRIELEGMAFQARVIESYHRLAASEPERFLVLDARQTPEQLAAQALSAIRAIQARTLGLAV